MSAAPTAHAAVAAATNTAPSSGMMMSMESPLGLVQHRLAEIGAAVSQAVREMLADAAEAPGRVDAVARFLTGRPDPAAAAALFAAFVVMLGVAALAAWVVHRLLATPRDRLSLLQPTSPARIAAAKLEALALGLIPVGTFLAAAQALLHSVLLDPMLRLGPVPRGTDDFATAATGIISTIAIGWAAYVVIVLPLSARRPGLRILPLDDAQALWGERVLGRIILVAFGGWTLAFGLYAAHFGHGLPQIVALSDGLVVAALSLWALRRIRHSVTGFARYWRRFAEISVVGLALSWGRGLLLLQRPPLGQVLTTALVLLLIPAIDGIVILSLRRLALRLATRACRRRMIFVPDEETDQLTEIERPADPSHVGTSPEMQDAIARLTGVLHDAIAWCVLFAAGFLLFHTWRLHVHDLFDGAMLRPVFAAGAHVALTVLVGWYLWRLFEAGLAMMLARDDGAPQSRSRTVEPLLRSVGFVVIGIGALMVVLSDIGISIAPLLASAGVVGIAVGFGAQTLIKDLFSGTCFLIEDVFRIGEYIEGANAKGTVEKITFRTIALRHQNGPLHFVPYGSLGTVRNNSRDWVIDKFELPLPIDTDSEQIRRMVKQIGQDIMEDAELSRHIMAPLKAKLYRVDPGVKVFRCKVQTEPGTQFEVRTEAYRRIEAALKEAGLSFATANQSVITLQNPPMADAPLSALGLASAAE